MGTWCNNEQRNKYNITQSCVCISLWPENPAGLGHICFKTNLEDHKGSEKWIIFSVYLIQQTFSIFQDTWTSSSRCHWCSADRRRRETWLSSKGAALKVNVQERGRKEGGGLRDGAGDKQESRRHLHLQTQAHTHTQKHELCILWISSCTRGFAALAADLSMAAKARAAEHHRVQRVVVGNSLGIKNKKRWRRQEGANITGAAWGFQLLSFVGTAATSQPSSWRRRIQLRSSETELILHEKSYI